MRLFVRNAALMLIVGLGLATGAMDARAETKSTIRAAMHSGVNILDPIVTTAHITRNFGYMIYDTLLSMNAKFEPTPQMAEVVTSPDGLTHTFTLRDGLIWHDGAPVTAEDCLASLKRWGARDAGGQMLMDAVESLTAVDDRTIALRLSRPFPLALDLIAKPSSIVPFMMPKRMAETPPTQAVKEQIGSGPFRFVAAEYRPGDRVVFERFAEYRPRKEPADWTSGGKVANVDRVEWLTLPDPQTAVNALLAGEIDFMEQAPIDLLPLIREKSQDVTIGVYNELGSQTIGRMNFLHPPFNDAKIRRAALYALNQQNILEALIGDPAYFRTCAAMFGCGAPYEAAMGMGAETIATGDVAKARALLKEAGYDGAPVVILRPDTQLTAPQPVVAAELLRAAGFTVDLQAMDWQTAVARRAIQKPPSEGGWSMFFTNWTIPEVWDPLVSLSIAGRGRKSFAGWPEDAEIERLRAAFASAESQDARRDIATAIQARAYDQVLFVPLGQFRYPSARRNDVTGWIKAPAPLFWGVRKAS